MMKTVSKSQFKPKAFEYFRMVEEKGETIVVTDRGKPVLKIVPFDEMDDPERVALKGTVVRYADPLEPIDQDWEASH
jgi:prevent-host-death family protein